MLVYQRVSVCHFYPPDSARRLKILQSPPALERCRRPGQLAAGAPAIGAPAGPTPGALFGLPADSGRAALSCLNLADHNSLRAVCHATRSLVDFEICRLAAGFTYKAELFDARRVTCTRSGRVMSNGDSGRSRRFLGFLTRHAKLLQQLDVRHAPTLRVCRGDFLCWSYLREFLTQRFHEVPPYSTRNIYLYLLIFTWHHQCEHSAKDWCFGVQDLEVGHSMHAAFDRDRPPHWRLELSCRPAAPVVSNSSKRHRKVVKDQEVTKQGDLQWVPAIKAPCKSTSCSMRWTEDTAQLSPAAQLPSCPAKSEVDKSLLLTQGRIKFIEKLLALPKRPPWDLDRDGHL